MPQLSQNIKPSYMPSDPQQKINRWYETLNTTPQNIWAILLVVCRLLGPTTWSPLKSFSNLYPPVWMLCLCIHWVVQNTKQRPFQSILVVVTLSSGWYKAGFDISPCQVPRVHKQCTCMQSFKAWGFSLNEGQGQILQWVSRVLLTDTLKACPRKWCGDVAV
jgi:hypothetical protein